MPIDVQPDTEIDYVQRVNRAIDHIVRHLDEPLPLEAVAQVACFSPFHFHRVFRSLVGETLNQFVRRLRLERALTLVAREPGRAFTDVALACGFSSSSDFSRAFKQRYGVPPSAFDIETWRRERREGIKDATLPDNHRHLLDRLPPGENPDNFEVAFRDLPARTIAYIRVANPYGGTGVGEATQRLMAWAEDRDLTNNQWLGYMWDDPDVVAHEDCRYDVGLEVDDDFRPEGEIGRLDLPAMRVAQIEVRGPIDMEMRALDWMYSTWLPSSGYLPTDQPCFEAWIGRPYAHGYEHFELYVQLPVATG